MPAIATHSTHFWGIFVKLTITPQAAELHLERKIPETRRFQLGTSSACLGRIDYSHRQEKTDNSPGTAGSCGDNTASGVISYTTTLDWLVWNTEFLWDLGGASLGITAGYSPILHTSRTI